MESPRPLRVSPFFQREEELGAVFLEGAGWERPQWYEANASLVERYADRIPAASDWAARYWSPIAGAEALATRDGVALYDMTSLKRIVVSGPGACAFLERLTTNRIDRPVGTVVYSLMLQADGGIRSDLTIARLGTGQVPGRGERQPRPRLAPAPRSNGRLGPHRGDDRRHVLRRRLGSAGARPRRSR